MSRYGRRIFLAIAAPALAAVIGVVVSAIVLRLSGEDPIDVFSSMLDYGKQPSSIVAIINRATPFYLAGVAVAIGFKMNLFNIGVEGQYLLAAMVAAAAGSAVELPAPLHVAFILIVAMLAGAMWAGIAGVLRATRGVSEVISTIMLNNIVTLGLLAYILNKVRLPQEGSLQLQTHFISESGWFPNLNSVLSNIGLDVPRGSRLTAFVLVALLVGVGYYLFIWRTRFGYDLRSSGINPFAALASGVSPRGMVIKTMLLSGAIAGLVGMSSLLGDPKYHRFTGDFPQGIGFTAIGIALVGRNHPVGIGVAALLWGFLERSAEILDLEDIPKQIVVIMQGVIVLSVVVAYELVRRAAQAQEQRAVSSQVEDERVTEDTLETVP